jgi:putative PEP-CTERM system TPR-repeat lipoprotein
MTGHSSDEVKAAVDRAIAANPTSVRPRLAMVAYYLQQGDRKSALAAAQSAREAFRNEPQVIEALGTTQLAVGESNQAVESFRQLVQLQPQSPGALIRLAEAQLAVKDYQSAISTLQSALKLQPDQALAWALLTKVYFVSGRPEEALAEARKQQKEHPDLGLGYTLEAEVLAAQKKWPEAAAAYAESLARQPLPIVAVRRYSALLNAGKKNEATAFADKWLKDHPKDPTFYIALGEQSILKRDYKAAVAPLEAALERDPDNTQVMNNLAYVLVELGDRRASGYAERAFQQAPNNASVVDTLGWVLLKNGDTSRGTQLLRVASSLAPANDEIRLHFAQALLKSGDKEAARRELEKLSKADSASPIRAEAEKLLAGI